MAEDKVRNFIAMVGEDELMQAVGVKARMMRHVKQKGVMPSKWYNYATELAIQNKVARPTVDMFEFGQPNVAE